MVTPVGKAEGVEVDNVSVGLMVCSFTVTVDVSMVVVGTFNPQCSCDLGICNQRTKISAEIKYNNKPSL